MPANSSFSGITVLAVTRNASPKSANLTSPRESHNKLAAFKSLKLSDEQMRERKFRIEKIHGKFGKVPVNYL